MHETPQTVNQPETESPVAPRAPRVRKPVVQIMREVAAERGITVDDLKAHNRVRHLVQARCEAMRRVAEEWEWLSYPIIGRIFGRDHTTVMYHLVKEGDRHKKKHCACDRPHARTTKKGGAE